MNILVVNCGSSSIKFQLLDMETEKLLVKGSVEKIGTRSAILNLDIPGKDKIKNVFEILDHQTALEKVVQSLMCKDLGIIKDKSDIKAVGHRVVHGGESYSDAVLIDNAVLTEIRNLIDLAPLHNPHNIKGIEVCQRLFPDVPQIAVFDTAFHQTMPPESYIYPLPYVLYKRYKIRRYGFHGTSHYFVAQKCAEIMGKPYDQLNIITAHLGNGCSITAIKKGRVIDTSMGFTPLEGLVMGTRCGDIDTSIITFVIAKEELSLQEANTLLNKHSGLMGISGVSNDMKDLTEASASDPRAKLAIDIFAYRLKKYIGAYAAALGGIDALVFTGGIGENCALVREISSEGMEYMGIKFDKDKNAQSRGLAELSKPDSKVKVFCIPTNEELVIARETKRIVGDKK
ncbi:MAG: acetate kinase [Candidatus Auribacterota bacterium]|nr:acetate kinase [Candidatus Auribacterota bacterium]